MNFEKFKEFTLTYQQDRLEFNDNIGLVESPIESIVLEELYKFKKERVKIIPQYSVRTVSGYFRPDFVLELGDRQISIECDGEEFHKLTQYYDEWRDALILVSSNIQSIFRLRGKDINENISDLIFFVAIKEPDFFDLEKIMRFKNLIKPDILNDKPFYKSSDKYDFVFDDFYSNGQPTKRMISIIWRNIKLSFDRFCIREILISYLCPGKPIIEMIKSDDYKSMNDEKLQELFLQKYPNNKK